jgi:hypothetical protein
MIGIPPGVSRGEFESATPSSRLTKWQAAVAEYFPTTAQSDNGNDVLVGNDAVYCETAVDAMKALKDEELIRYRKEVERKAKLAENSSDDKPKVKKSEEKRSRD